MKVELRTLALGLAMAALGMAAEIDGVLMDKTCSPDVAKTGQTGALKHERQCALMDECAKSGYGVVTSDNKFLKFDKAGDEKMLAMLKGTQKKDNLRIKVTGDVQGDNITVQSLDWQ